MRTIVSISIFLLLAAAPAGAEPVFEEGAYPDLDAKMKRHGRQFYLLSARPFGLSLDAFYPDDAARVLVDQFLAQDASDDVEAVTGKHPFEIFSAYGEYGDLGFFGGVAVVGTAYEYMTYKHDGASPDVLALARERVVRAAESWHVFYVVTGGGGLVARGIRRMVPEDPADPPIPGVDRETTPLFDGDGNPLPQPKNNGTDRVDNSGGVLPSGVWQWADSCSKDQLVGQVFAMVALYDAMKDDPNIDQALVERMREDARLVGEMLMTRRDLTDVDGVTATGEYDLVIMDADGRPTYYHDLNPLSLEKLYFAHDSESYNRFNLLMALGVIKGLHHVSGDPALEEYLYEELLHRRKFLEKINREKGAIDYIYAGVNTNPDNPDMTAVALWLALYLENDPEVTTELRTYLEEGWWNRPDEMFTAAKAKQPFWSAVYMTLTDRGVDPSLADRTADELMGFELGPYWNDERINCDQAEIEARECLAVDGQTVLTLAGRSERDGWKATEALHPRIRPPSNFDARSSAFRVNENGFNRLNPGGDLLASYWIARYMQANVAGEINLSPNVRDHMPVGGWPPGHDGGTNSGDGDGCGCGGGGRAGLAFLLFLPALLRRKAA